MLVVTEHCQPWPVLLVTELSRGEPSCQQPRTVMVVAMPIPAPRRRQGHQQPSPSIVVGDLLPEAITGRSATPVLVTPYSTPPAPKLCRPAPNACGVAVAVILATDDETLMGTLALATDPDARARLASWPLGQLVQRAAGGMRD
jgi:hypothetical protein